MMVMCNGNRHWTLQDRALYTTQNSIPFKNPNSPYSPEVRKKSDRSTQEHSAPRGNFTRLYLNIEEKYAEEYKRSSVKATIGSVRTQIVFLIKYIKCGAKEKEKNVI